MKILLFLSLLLYNNFVEYYYISHINSPMSVRIYLILFLVNFIVSCKTVHHGYKFENQEQIQSIKSMVNNKYSIEKVINVLGSPTFINSPINDTMCYAGVDIKSVAFNPFFYQKYAIVCISFEENIAKDIIIKEYTDIKEEKFIKYNVSLKKNDFGLTKDEIKQIKQQKK